MYSPANATESQLNLTAKINYIFPSQDILIAASIGFDNTNGNSGNVIALIDKHNVIRYDTSMVIAGYTSNLVISNSTGIIYGASQRLDQIRIDSLGGAELPVDVFSVESRSTIISLLHHQQSVGKHISMPLLAADSLIYLGFEDQQFLSIYGLDGKKRFDFRIASLHQSLVDSTSAKNYIVNNIELTDENRIAVTICKENPSQYFTINIFTRTGIFLKTKYIYFSTRSKLLDISIIGDNCYCLIKDNSNASYYIKTFKI